MKFILPVLVTLFAFAFAAPSLEEEGLVERKCYDKGCKNTPFPIPTFSSFILLLRKCVCGFRVLKGGNRYANIGCV